MSSSLTNKDSLTSMDTWNIQEQLALASAVTKSGENWDCVSRIIKAHFEKTRRPLEWFSPKNCERQYNALLDNVEKPKCNRGSTESTVESIISTLKDGNERIKELKFLITQGKDQYVQMCKQVEEIESGIHDDHLSDFSDDMDLDSDIESDVSESSSASTRHSGTKDPADKLLNLVDKIVLPEESEIQDPVNESVISVTDNNIDASIGEKPGAKVSLTPEKSTPNNPDVSPQLKDLVHTAVVGASSEDDGPKYMSPTSAPTLTMLSEILPREGGQPLPEILSLMSSPNKSPTGEKIQDLNSTSVPEIKQLNLEDVSITLKTINDHNDESYTVHSLSEDDSDEKLEAKPSEEANESNPSKDAMESKPSEEAKESKPSEEAKESKPSEEAKESKSSEEAKESKPSEEAKEFTVLPTKSIEEADETNICKEKQIVKFSDVLSEQNNINTKNNSDTEEKADESDSSRNISPKKSPKSRKERLESTDWADDDSSDSAYDSTTKKTTVTRRSAKASPRKPDSKLKNNEEKTSFRHRDRLSLPVKDSKSKSKTGRSSESKALTRVKHLSEEASSIYGDLETLTGDGFATRMTRARAKISSSTAVFTSASKNVTPSLERETSSDMENKAKKRSQAVVATTITSNAVIDQLPPVAMVSSNPSSSPCSSTTNRTLLSDSEAEVEEIAEKKKNILSNDRKRRAISNELGIPDEKNRKTSYSLVTRNFYR